VLLIGGQLGMDASNIAEVPRGHTRSCWLFWLVTASLFFISAALHLWRLGSVPAGFYVDESSHAYNAYCIARTGADEYGTKFPVFFRCLDDYRDPVMIYFLAPWVKTFGLGRGVTRFPSALFLILASIAFAFLVQRYCHNQWLAVLTGFCFSILPWTFVVSRINTAGYTAMLFGMVVALLLTLLALEKRSTGHAIAAGAAWAFAMYAYTVGRPMSVAILLCFGLAYVSVIKTQRKIWLLFMVSLVVALIPMVVSVVHAPFVLTNRFQKVSILKDHSAWSQIPSRIGSRYIEYFSPQFLFFKGDGNLRQHSGFGGELFLFLIPMVLAGLFCLVRFSKDNPGYRFIGLGILVYPLAATLTSEHMHSGRSINGVIFWALTAAIGANFLWRNKMIGRSLLLLACSAGIIEGALYMKDYFGPYQLRSRYEFQTALTSALDGCFHTLDYSHPLYISDSVLETLIPPQDHDFKPFLYADILFFGKIDPRIYLRSGIPANRVCVYDGVIREHGLLLRCNLRLRVPVTTENPPDFEPNREPIPTGATLLATIPFDPTMRYEVYDVK